MVMSEEREGTRVREGGRGGNFILFFYFFYEKRLILKRETTGTTVTNQIEIYDWANKVWYNTIPYMIGMKIEPMFSKSIHNKVSFPKNTLPRDGLEFCRQPSNFYYRNH